MGQFESGTCNQSSVDGPCARRTVEDYRPCLATQARADARGRPVKIISRTVLDYGLAFSKLNTGNIATVVDSSVGFKPGGGYGFDAQARIRSISYNDLSNKCPLNLEII